jgi:hypothetical protein
MYYEEQIFGKEIEMMKRSKVNTTLYIDEFSPDMIEDLVGFPSICIRGIATSRSRFAGKMFTEENMMSFKFSYIKKRTAVWKGWWEYKRPDEVIYEAGLCQTFGDIKRCIVYYPARLHVDLEPETNIIVTGRAVEKRHKEINLYAYKIEVLTREEALRPEELEGYGRRSS